MSKKKNGKRAGLAEAVYQRKSNAMKGAQKTTNPFEVHVNRPKFSVMNRDTKNDRGLPGVSRAKAAKRRQETLGQEMNQMHKSNRFKDNRIGSGGRFKSGDDLATAKFAKEMMSRHESKASKRKSLFNLHDHDGGGGEDDEGAAPAKQLLTHKGQTLKEIEQFQDAVSDGDEEAEDEEMLNAEFTDAAHFGGGRSSGEEEDRRSRKDLIDDLISETRRRKAEAAKEKDQVQNMTDKLDEAWRSLIPVMGKLTRTDDVRIKPDAYDKTMREMIFEARGEPTDKLKTKEELAKVERQKLERLERDRLRRMRGETEEAKPKHRSADDLGDEYYDELVGEEEVDGNVPEVEEGDDAVENDDDEDEDGFEEEEETDEDNFSDLKSSDDEEEEATEEPLKKKKGTGKLTPSAPTETLPFTFELPESYEELSAVLQNKSPSDQSTVVERIIKCNDPSLDPTNKDKLISLQAFLCQYFNDLFDCDELTEENAIKAFEVFDKLTPHMFRLAEMNSLATGNLLREILSEKQDDLKSLAAKGRFPNLDVMMFLRLVGRLFSTSDYKHGVVTPAFVLISQLLTRCVVESGRDIARGLLVATIALDFTAQSKRLLPAVIVFLDGIFRLAVAQKNVDSRTPFQFNRGPELTLKVEEQSQNNKKKKKKDAEGATPENSFKLMTKDLIGSAEMDDGFKCRIINTATTLARRFFDQVQENVASMYYAQDLNSIVGSRLKLNVYPEVVRENLEALQVQLLHLQERKLTPLRIRDQPVKQLRMLEPKFEAEQYHDRRVKSSKPTDKSLQEAMRHKVKREMKGALRDIKLDNAFVAKTRLNKQRIMDRERKEKVKRIFAEASVQQGELNAMDRQNNRKKK